MPDKKDNKNNNSSNRAVIENDTSPQAMFVSQKCNRLASAIYAVTRLLADDEPLKNKLRKLAVSVSDTARRPGSNSEYASLYDLLARLRDHLTIARDGGLLSSMNHQVLTEEIANLQDRLHHDDVSFGPHINSEYFAVEDTLPASGEGRNKSAGSSSKSVPAQKSGDDTQTNTSTKPSSAKQRRREKILKLFEETDEITVNDVTEVINGYSTKTIQRDLKALVESGKLEKHGKRRWTSYTKA